MILAMILTTIFMSGHVEPAAFKSEGCDFFTYANVAKVLGGKATGADTGFKDGAETRKWGCTFTASDRGENPPKIYFSLMRSNSADIAQAAFEVSRESNKKHPGFNEWPGVGDEAVVQTDAPNFHFVMVRKGSSTIAIKINPANVISLDTVKAAATEIASRMK